MDYPAASAALLKQHPLLVEHEWLAKSLTNTIVGIVSVKGQTDMLWLMNQLLEEQINIMLYIIVVERVAFFPTDWNAADYTVFRNHVEQYRATIVAHNLIRQSTIAHRISIAAAAQQSIAQLAMGTHPSSSDT